MKFKKLIAAMSVIAMLGSFAVVAYAESEYVAKSTSTVTAADSINATDDNIKKQSGDNNGQVRITPVENTTDNSGVTTNNNGMKMGVFKLGKLVAGEKISVTVNLKTCNNDLSAVGLYTSATEIPTGTDTDFKTLYDSGVALVPMGSLKTPASTNPLSFSITTMDTTNIPTDGQGGKLSSVGSVSCCDIEITDANAGYVYFVAGAWNGTNRLVQVVDLTITREFKKLNDAVTAGDDSVIELLSDTTLTERIVNSSKNITINGNDCTVITDNKLFEFPSGKGTITINDLTVEAGTSKMDFKGNTVVNATNFACDNLQIGGDKTNLKGTFKNASITNLTLYGQIELEKTEIASLVLPNISATTDRPAVNADSTSSIGGASITAVGENAITADAPYTLFTGDLKPENVTVPDGYVYGDGIVSVYVAPVAKIGEVGYYSLNEAMTAAVTNDTIDILGDTAVSGNLTPSAHDLVITINGNANTVTSNDLILCGDFWGTKLTFDNVTFSSSSSYFTAEAKNGATFTVDSDATIANTSGAPAIALHSSTTNKAVVYGTVSSTGTYAVEMNGASTLELGSTAVLVGGIKYNSHTNAIIDATAYAGDTINVTVADDVLESVVGTTIVTGATDKFVLSNDGYSLVNGVITAKPVEVTAAASAVDASNYSDSDVNSVWTATLTNDTGFDLTTIEAAATAGENSTSNSVTGTTIANGSTVTIAVLINKAADALSNVSVTLK